MDACLRVILQVLMLLWPTFLKSTERQAAELKAAERQAAKRQAAERRAAKSLAAEILEDESLAAEFLDDESLAAEFLEAYTLDADSLDTDSLDTDSVDAESQAVESQVINKSLPWKIQVEAPIRSLHDDAIYFIVSSLPPADAAAFVLASKSFWQAADGQRVVNRLSEPSDSRIDFLERIEAQFPEHVLCYRCQKFHTQCEKNPLLKPGQCDTETAIHFFGPKDERNIPCLIYRQAKEVMNHYRFGPTHGRCAAAAMSIHTFYLKPHGEYWSTKGVWNLDIKLISNNLILKEDVWIMYRASFPHDASDYLNGFKKHLLPEISLFNKTSDCYYCYRCPLSHSEREFRISRLRYKPSCILIRSTTWENLGACKNSEESLWEHGTEFSPCNFARVAIQPGDLKYKHHFDSELPSRDHRGKEIDFW
ncbi:hypothetical protein H109_04035 [Trichophyton interdigitale MR816]|uniref:F-box domain-containing protein n=1 Tax=Trichophyton interdigitale (strain MR816) TaxID=1215338 RepID=A0A059J8B7_TRIIM|nr:hypothetical protein H101_01129 [Trichophyton interdigitale H6]KDB24090.1 hypothetical protein H109_04035 [Trichophyton interdigitale MR816]